MLYRRLNRFSTNMNPYQQLGISPGASMDEVKKAYYKVVKQYHPDLNKDNPQAEETFKSIVKAYETLIDPTNRQIYDLSQKNSNFGQTFQDEGKYEEDQNKPRYYENKWYAYKKPNYHSQFDEYQNINVESKELAYNQIVYRIFFIMGGLFFFDFIRMYQQSKHEEFLNVQQEIFKVQPISISSYIDQQSELQKSV